MADSTQAECFLNEIRETMDWEKRKAALNTKFLATFHHAFLHAKAYREIYLPEGIGESTIQGLEDLEKLPVLHMRDLVERQKYDSPFGGFDIIDPERVRRIYINPGLIFQPGDWENRDTSWAEALCGAGLRRGELVGRPTSCPKLSPDADVKCR